MRKVDRREFDQSIARLAQLAGDVRHMYLEEKADNADFDILVIEQYVKQIVDVLAEVGLHDR